MTIDTDESAVDLDAAIWAWLDVQGGADEADAFLRALLREEGSEDASAPRAALQPSAEFDGEIVK